MINEQFCTPERCDWKTTEEAWENGGRRRWQICSKCGAERKQRKAGRGWSTVWQHGYASAFDFLRNNI